MIVFKLESVLLVVAILLHGRLLFSQEAGLDPIDSNLPNVSDGVDAIPAEDADDLGALDQPQAPNASQSEVVPPQKVVPTDPQENSDPVVTEIEKPLEASGTKEEVGSVEAAPALVVEQENIPAQSSPDQADASKIKTKTRKESIVGSYRLHLGAAGVDFDEDKSYKEHYDTTRLLPSFKVEYFFFDWYATLGVSLQAGMYKDKGYSLDGDGNKVTGESLALTLFPLQFAGVFALSPFTQKWISLSGWAGIEYLRFSETRPDSVDSQGQVRNLKGTRTGSVAGGALHIRIDFLDETSAASMAVIGLNHIYISPYFQTINRTSSQDKIHFSRNEFGVFFSFESI